MDRNDKTLSQVLKEVGWRHEPPANPSRQGRHVYRDDGTDLGVMSAHECWAKLRELGLVG
jgi:hypothetical protein